jgi:UDP-N-acetylglucosamine 2-epimerase
MKQLRIVNVVGARPQFVKLGPVSRAVTAHNEQARDVRLEEVIVHTGQHYDADLSEVFFDELRLPRPAVNLEVGSGSHGQQTAAILARMEAYLLATPADAVIVYGDTNTTLAAGLAAAKLNQFLVHVEAGLRSRNRRMPEEINRVAIDHVADLLCAPTDEAMKNLDAEGLADRAALTGDVMVDTLEYNLQRARETSTVRESFGVEPGAYAVATVHRAENTEPEVLEPLVNVLRGLATDILPVVFPMHPRTAHRYQGAAADTGRRLVMTRPLGYLDMISLVSQAALVITDSGGLQKEAFCLGVPCVTLRRQTEWPETMAAGANVLVGTDAAKIAHEVRRARECDTAARRRFAEAARAVYGRGTAGPAVVAAILRALVP